MVRIPALTRGFASVALLVALAACSAAPAASPASVAPPTIAPSPTPSPSPSVPEVAPPSESAAPSKSAKPRPSIDQADLDAFLTSSITLVDLADGSLAVTVSYVDPDSDDAIPLGVYPLEFTDQLTNAVPAGMYRLEFRQPADSATGPTCTIEIADGDGYVFAAVDGAIAISRTGDTPSDARELFVATSSLCLE